MTKKRFRRWVGKQMCSRLGLEIGLVLYIELKEFAFFATHFERDYVLRVL